MSPAIRKSFVGVFFRNSACDAYGCIDRGWVSVTTSSAVLNPAGRTSSIEKAENPNPYKHLYPTVIYPCKIPLLLPVPFCIPLRMLQSQDLLLPHPLILKLGFLFTITAMSGVGLFERFHDSSVRRLQFMRHVRWNAIYLHVRQNISPTTAYLVVNKRNDYFSENNTSHPQRNCWHKGAADAKKIVLCVNSLPEDGYRRSAICWKYIYSYVHLLHRRCIKSHMHVFWASRVTWRSLWLQWPSRIRKTGFYGDGQPPLTNSFIQARNVLMFIHQYCWRIATATAGAPVNFAHGKMKTDGIQWHSCRTMSHCDLSPDVDLPICILALTESNGQMIFQLQLCWICKTEQRGIFATHVQLPREIMRPEDWLILLFSINIYSAFCKLNWRWLLII